MPRSKKSTSRAKPKPEAEFKPKRWWRSTTWLVSNYGVGYVIAAVMLGVLFLMTAALGTVTNEDVTAVAVLQASHGKGQAVHFRGGKGPTQLVPALLLISKTVGPHVVCGYAPETQVVGSSTIRISNRFGKTMQAVLGSMEWLVGLVYEIHFPTSLEAIAKDVRDPSFGNRIVDLEQPDLLKMTRTLLERPECQAAVELLVRNGGLVCPATWFWWAPDRKELLAVGISSLCITLDTDTKPRSISNFDPLAWLMGTAQTPFFTSIKVHLGILHAEVDHGGRQ